MCLLYNMASISGFTFTTAGFASLVLRLIDLYFYIKHQICLKYKLRNLLALVVKWRLISKSNWNLSIDYIIFRMNYLKVDSTGALQIGCTIPSRIFHVQELKLCAEWHSFLKILTRFHVNHLWLAHQYRHKEVHWCVEGQTRMNPISLVIVKSYTNIILCFLYNTGRKRRWEAQGRNKFNQVWVSWPGGNINGCISYRKIRLEFDGSSFLRVKSYK